VLPAALAIAPLRDVVATALKVAPVKKVLPALLAAAAPLHDVLLKEIVEVLLTSGVPLDLVREYTNPFPTSGSG